jgi:hypothetical protein
MTTVIPEIAQRLSGSQQLQAIGCDRINRRGVNVFAAGSLCIGYVVELRLDGWRA